MLRYVFVPLVQLETPEFRRMVQALFDGMDEFLPFMRYDLQLFHVRRICGVPGYQYDVDMSREQLCRQLFTAAEALQLRQRLAKHAPGSVYGELIFGSDVPLIDVQKARLKVPTPARDCGAVASTGLHMMLMPILRLDDPSELCVRIVCTNEWSKCLNGSKFNDLSKRDQYLVRFRILLTRLYGEWRLIRLILEALLTVALGFMEKWQRSVQRTQRATG